MSPTMGGRATPSISQQRVSSQRLTSTPSMTGLGSRARDFGSQDSLNSVGSAVSTASRSRVRLGVTSLLSPRSTSTSTQQVYHTHTAHAEHDVWPPDVVSLARLALFYLVLSLPAATALNLISTAGTH